MTEKVTNIFAEDLVSGSLLVFIVAGLIGIFLALAMPADTAANLGAPYGEPAVIEKESVFDDSGKASTAMAEQADAWAEVAFDKGVRNTLGAALYLDVWRKHTLNGDELTIKEYNELKVIFDYFRRQQALHK